MNDKRLVLIHTVPPLLAVFDKLVPEPENPHEAVSFEDMKRAAEESSGLVEPPENESPNPALARLGLMSALVIGIHNFPEGMATGTFIQLTDGAKGNIDIIAEDMQQSPAINNVIIQDNISDT